MAKSPSEVIIGELTRIRSTLERLEQQESASKDAFNALYSEMEDYKKRASAITPDPAVPDPGCPFLKINNGTSRFPMSFAPK